MFANTTHSGSGRGFALVASAFATFVLFPAFTVAAEDTIKRRDALDFGPGSLKSGLGLVGFTRRSGSRKRASRAEEARRTEGESKSDTIGPWKIEAVFKGDMFDRCSINRTLKDDLVATFVRTGEGLSLELQSPNWKLEDGKHYPVKMTLGPLTIDTEVAARPNSVSTEIKDEKFAAELRSASALDVAGAGATIRVPLNTSEVALDRLEKCVEKNNRTVQTNPFVAPARQP